MLSPNPNARPTTFGIRARPPLCDEDSNYDPTLIDETCHFQLHNRKRLISNNLTPQHK
jgi:hypothetical protein